MLAAAVILPYDAIGLIQVLKVLHGVVGGLFSFALFVADFALVLPLISALHVHAVADVREGREPKIGSVARRGLASLPVLCRAAGFAYIGTFLGLIALVIPGVILALQWAVVAQVATLGAKNWRGALEESKQLTNGRHRHIFGLLLILLVITVLPGVVLDLIFGFHPTVARYLIVSAIGVPINSFTALAVGLLYYDLTARRHAEPIRIPRRPSSAALDSAPGDPLTPLAYTDERRSPGWYIDPENPRRMRYWLGEWSTRTTKTPKRRLVEWEQLRESQPE